MDLGKLDRLKRELTRFLMMYKFATEGLETKLDIFKQEFQYTYDYNPIQQVTTRVKSPESILQKAHRKGFPISIPSFRENIRDIAGMRVTCSFVSDIYRISDMLGKQSDLHIEEYKDYIKNPKDNGYQSLHLIVKVPVSMLDKTELIWAEIQLRTVAMDFWANLEHKLNYKYNYDIPQPLLDELTAAAQLVVDLDQKMESINREVNNFKATQKLLNDAHVLHLNDERFHLPLALLELLR